jgi:hypothetical protein
MTFLYYRFLAIFHRAPTEPEDFFDGLRTANAFDEIESLAWQRK